MIAAWLAVGTKAERRACMNFLLESNGSRFGQSAALIDNGHVISWTMFARRVKRLAQIVVGTGLESDDAVDRFITCREQDDGDVFAQGAKAATGFGAIATRHHPVEYDQVRRKARDACGKTLRVGCQQGVIAMLVEIVGE